MLSCFFLCTARAVFRAAPRLAAGVAAVLCLGESALAASQTLEDVQIGERGRTLRVALICTTQCAVAPDAAGGFRLDGVRAALDIDLSGRSRLASRLQITPREGSSLLMIEPSAAISRAAIITCDSDTEPAPCIELVFAPEVETSSSASLAAAPPSAPREKAPAMNATTPKQAAPTTAPTTAPVRAAPAIRESAANDTGADNLEAPENMPFLGAAILDARPRLREGAAPLSFPQFAPPERLAPPAASPPDLRSDAADVEPESVSQSTLASARPALIDEDPAKILAAAGVDIRAEAGAILGKSLDVGACEGARARLMADAWALESMIDLAFCKAADGDLAAADSDFSRLLAYTPDNYEALVGRGLVALAEGDARQGRKFFQDALNALPPIAESERIVSAMDRL
ncbi:MAG: hypothetical protein R3C40_05990 [Parvularculaceae bacterium]